MGWKKRPQGTVAMLGKESQAAGVVVGQIGGPSARCSAMAAVFAVEAGEGSWQGADL